MPDSDPHSLEAITASMIVKQEPKATEADAKSARPAPAPDSLSGGRGAEQGNQTPNQEAETEEQGSTPRTEDTILDDQLDSDDQDEDEDDDGAEAQTASNDEDEEEDILSDSIFDADQEGADDDTSTDDFDTSKLGDDVKVSVTVDGEEVNVPLGELKRRYAGEGAIDKRLQEATEARNRIVSDYEQSRQLTEQVMQQFGQALFRRTVPEPSLDLLRANPTEYHVQKELYEQESNALIQSHQQLADLMGRLDAQNNTAREQRRAEAAKELRRIMPVFNDPVKGPKVRQVLVDTAGELGFTQEDIAACEDPRIFKAIALAARELRRQKGVKVEKTTPSSRTIQSGSRKPVASASSSKRKEKAVFDRAKQHGDPDDIIATMIVDAPRKRGRR